MFGVLLFFALVSFGQTRKKAVNHPDYVPDTKTAERIAEAVLIGQFGDDRVAAQLPLHVESASNNVWLVEGVPKDQEGRPQVGGGFGVWVNKYDGRVSVMERMK
jgi:hypothetical protein